MLVPTHGENGQHTSPTHQHSTPAQHTSPAHQVNTPAQHTSPKHQVSTPAQHISPTSELLIDCQRTRDMRWCIVDVDKPCTAYQYSTKQSALKLAVCRAVSTMSVMTLDNSSTGAWCFNQYDCVTASVISVKTPTYHAVLHNPWSSNLTATLAAAVLGSLSRWVSPGIMPLHSSPCQWLVSH